MGILTPPFLEKRAQKGSKKGKKYLGGRDSFIVLVPCCFSPFLGPFFQKGRRRFCALFLKKSPKRAISTNGFIPSGETYQWFL